MTLSLIDRANLVLTEAWRLLPPLKREAIVTDVLLDDLGAVHGLYTPDTGALTLSVRLLWGDTAADVDCIDVHGMDPPMCYPLVSRALHTATHEFAHALGTATGLDSCAAWLALSGWAKTWDERPGQARYWERRPGWEPGPSDWSFRATDTYFVRDYASKSPFEDFADSVTHCALGWDGYFMGPAGAAKRAWIRRNVWEETGAAALQACAARWTEHATDAGRAMRTLWQGVSLG